MKRNHRFGAAPGLLALAATLLAAPATRAQDISSPDGLWRATLDSNGTGQITNLFLSDTDHLFETLWYEASGATGGVSARVESIYSNTGSAVNPDSASYELLRGDGMMNLVVTVTMLDGPTGGAHFSLTWTNLGESEEVVKPFAYADLDVNASAGGDFAAWSAAPQGVDQSDGGVTIRFDGVQDHKS